MHNRLLDPEPDMADHIDFDPKHIFNVEGMVVVITGGGTGSILSTQHATVLVYPLLGIGLMMATVLEHNGATVYIVGRRRAVLEKAAKENSVSKKPPLSSELVARLVRIRNAER
jgi:NAD(P)-dependent dehydrogenase (short-subunit alcohol dehydrogenase family)